MFGLVTRKGYEKQKIKVSWYHKGMKPYEPCVEDATAHIHVDWKTHESTGKLAPYPKIFCSVCPPSTAAESEEEYRKYAAYEKREALKYATRRPSKSIRLWVYRNRILIASGFLMAAYFVIHWILR